MFADIAIKAKNNHFPTILELLDIDHPEITRVKLFASRNNLQLINSHPIKTQYLAMNKTVNKQAQIQSTNELLH